MLAFHRPSLAGGCRECLRLRASTGWLARHRLCRSPQAVAGYGQLLVRSLAAIPATQTSSCSSPCEGQYTELAKTLEQHHGRLSVSTQPMEHSKRTMSDNVAPHLSGNSAIRDLGHNKDVRHSWSSASWPAPDTDSAPFRPADAMPFQHFWEESSAARRFTDLEYTASREEYRISRQAHELQSTTNEDPRLVEREIELERETTARALEEYREIYDKLVSVGQGANLPAVQKLMFAWYEAAIKAMEGLRSEFKKGKEGDWGDLVAAGTYAPMVELLDSKVLAVLTLHETVNAVLKAGNGGVPNSWLCTSVGSAVQTEINFMKLDERFGKSVVKGLREAGKLKSKRINKRAADALNEGVWAPETKLQLGAELVKRLIESVTFLPAGSAEPVRVFYRELKGIPRFKVRGVTFMQDEAYQVLAQSKDSVRYVMPRVKPMLVQPKPWTKYDSSPYYEHRALVVRTSGLRSQIQELEKAEMPQVYDALNYLGSIKWVINREVYDVVKRAWALKLMIGDLPSQVDLTVQTLQQSLGLQAVENDAWLLERRVKKVNAELNSLRCDTNLKLKIADEFLNDIFYFPYNMDFRGRAYPLPPNLNHLGSDMCRGVLMFAEKKPLGLNGLRWLKIHLANLCGKDKLSFQGREEFIDSVMGEVLDSAKNPLTGKAWWQQAEDPWQALAVCKEIAAGLKSGNPSTYLSGLPVHQDGSCNGLQHYAALGRDQEGGKQVNLLHSAEPQDVYTGVCRLVIQHVHQEATSQEQPGESEEQKKQRRLAQLVDGLIDRKVVKQTVMTSVYGVTAIGARKQIQARLKEKFQARKNGALLTKAEEDDVYFVSRYLAKVTLDQLGQLFANARDIMGWLAKCASLVAKQGEPMAWTTPLGLPVVQPYRRDRGYQVRTVLQHVVLVDCNDSLPVSKSRQRSAFPPNFVHSLDSTHMLMTTSRLKQMGVPFTAVHDSYWCHACNVEKMNDTLRQAFVDLYRRPILEDLRQSLVERYPDVEFPAVPERGQLDLEAVKDSPYFFD